MRSRIEDFRFDSFTENQIVEEYKEANNYTALESVLSVFGNRIQSLQKAKIYAKVIAGLMSAITIFFCLMAIVQLLVFHKDIVGLGLLQLAHS